MSGRRPGERPTVVVTGLGAYTAFGRGAAALWEGCLAGRSAACPVPSSWSTYFTPVSPAWAPLPEHDWRRHGLSRVETMQNDPAALLVAVAAEEALADAGLALVPADPRASTVSVSGVAPARAGVVVGTGIGGVSTLLAMQAHQILAGSAIATDPGRRVFPKRFNPFVVPMSMPSAAAAMLGIKFGFRGMNETKAVACASGTVAVGHAFRAIREGRLDLALAGGTEYLGDPYGGVFRGFDAARTLARGSGAPAELCRPFDEGRSGFLFSEGGAGMLVLESLDAARARGAPVLAEVCGFDESFEAHSMMSMEPSGAAIEGMLRGLLAAAGVEAGQVGYVNAHGTGTERNDEVEAGCLARVFGERVLTNSTKSILGHTIGASGALEALVTVKSLSEQRVHPSLNVEAPIAPIELARTVVERAMEYALSQSFAFGGHNAALLFRRPS